MSNDNLNVLRRLCVCLSAFRALLRVGGTTRMVSANSQYFLRLYALNSRTCSFGSPESMKPDAFALFNLLTDTLAVVGHGVIPVQSDSCTKIAEIAFSCPISIKLLKNFALELRSSHGTAFHTFVYKLLSKMHRSGKTADRFLDNLMQKHSRLCLAQQLPTVTTEITGVRTYTTCANLEMQR